MRLTSLLALPASLVASLYTTADASEYREHLHLKPLSAASLYTGFEFTASTPLSSYDADHFRYFPRSLAQILQYTNTAELHLRFALGRWDEENWGSRPRSGSREGGNGVELWAWIEADERGQVEERWSDLVNSLSGLFCASLNFIDSGKTTRPVLSFEPQGTLGQWQALQQNRTGKSRGKLELLHGMLPHEVVCTENLTPLLKLLPCKGKAGISSLLDGHKVFDASWQTMSIDVEPSCTAENCNLTIQQTVDMVLDVPRSMRPRDNPIPRPPPIEEIKCDESKYYNSQDTCFPQLHDGEMAWSLERIFGRPIKGSCPLSDPGWHEVSLEVSKDRSVAVIPETTKSALSPVLDASEPDGHSGVTHHYQLAENTDFDVSLPQQTIESGNTLASPPLHASRQITGYGAQRGGMHITLSNPQPFPQRVVYLESLPWFLRPYVHTLQVQGGNIAKMYYTPLLDRKRGTHLELLLDVPAHSTVTLTYDFEKAILRYTEYPPDANRGFDVAPAIVRVQPAAGAVAEGEQYDYYLRTTSLLLPLPTPDFSMPYNVIILTSTVIALGFGSIFNLLVRRFVLPEEVPPSTLGLLVKDKLGKAKESIKRLKSSEPASAVAAKGQSSDVASGHTSGIATSNGKPVRKRDKKDSGKKVQ